ncbi:MAG TPA: peptidoglycan bridge formation glycyltransferase FemA/FemB family protein, partial [Spirochaetia bacterium]|nr:peptidoglycan bridge formation glycyltransferase FemA/FemB family protein [Spirochaetia bacterium]
QELGRSVARAIPGLLFVRFDLPSPVHGDSAAPAKLDFRSVLAGMTPAPVDVQPPSTVVLDITAAPEAILAGMKAKTRYNIRLAERKGVEVVRAALDRFDTFYRLYRETAGRDHIAIHSEEYYRTLFELSNTFSGRSPLIRLYLAVHEGEELAAIITAFYGRRATYLYGASSNEKRNLMPAYLLQWRAMNDAKEAGCREYDLFGIPPSDDPLHPMSGLYRFKTGFGGEILHRPGCWDVPLRQGMYAAYRVAEWARSFYFHRLRKRGRGERS